MIKYFNKEIQGTAYKLLIGLLDFRQRKNHEFTETIMTVHVYKDYYQENFQVHTNKKWFEISRNFMAYFFSFLLTLLENRQV